jgi:hypothetical protein
MVKTRAVVTGIDQMIRAGLPRKLKAIEHSGPEEKPVEYSVTLTFD